MALLWYFLPCSPRYFFLIALAIVVISPVPVFYRHKRLGQNGRVFDVLKFQTMVMDADKQLEKLKDLNEADGPVFKIRTTGGHKKRDRKSVV